MGRGVGVNEIKGNVMGHSAVGVGGGKGGGVPGEAATLRRRQRQR